MPLESKCDGPCYHYPFVDIHKGKYKGLACFIENA